jgi:hypothetical protein
MRGALWLLVAPQIVDRTTRGEEVAAGAGAHLGGHGFRIGFTEAVAIAAVAYVRKVDGSDAGLA